MTPQTACGSNLRAPSRPSANPRAPSPRSLANPRVRGRAHRPIRARSGGRVLLLPPPPPWPRGAAAQAGTGCTPAVRAGPRRARRLPQPRGPPHRLPPPSPAGSPARAMLLLAAAFIVAVVLLLYMVSPLISPKPLKLPGAHVVVSRAMPLASPSPPRCRPLLADRPRGSGPAGRDEGAGRPRPPCPGKGPAASVGVLERGPPREGEGTGRKETRGEETGGLTRRKAVRRHAARVSVSTSNVLLVCNQRGRSEPLRGGLSGQM